MERNTLSASQHTCGYERKKSYNEQAARLEDSCENATASNAIGLRKRASTDQRTAESKYGGAKRQKADGEESVQTTNTNINQRQAWRPSLITNPSYTSEDSPDSDLKLSDPPSMNKYEHERTSPVDAVPQPMDTNQVDAESLAQALATFLKPEDFRTPEKRARFKFESGGSSKLRSAKSRSSRHNLRKKIAPGKQSPGIRMNAFCSSDEDETKTDSLVDNQLEDQIAENRNDSSSDIFWDTYI